MIFSLQTPTEELERAYATPGLYLRTPAPETYTIQPSAVGLPGFIGYARRRLRPAAGMPSWPVLLSSAEEARQQLVVPNWGLLLPALELFFANGGRQCAVVGLEDDAPHALERLLPADPERGSGLPAFDRAGGLELILAPDLFMVPPGCVQPRLEQVVQLQHCLLELAAGKVLSTELGGGLALLDVPPGLTPVQLRRWMALLRLHPLASYGAVYGPWVLVPAPRSGRRVALAWRETQAERALLAIPPSAAVAGLISSLSMPPGDRDPQTITADFGPQQSPANRRIEGIFGLEQSWSPDIREVLLRDQVNCLISRSGDGFRLWGDRTLSRDPALRQITVRRILSFIQRSITLSSRWAVFEPNTWTLWLQLTAQVEIFLETLYNAGIVTGRDPEDAFFVKCDSDTNPPEAIEAGRITLQLAVRPARATEVMVIEITHVTDGQPGQTAAKTTGSDRTDSGTPTLATGG